MRIFRRLIDFCKATISFIAPGWLSKDSQMELEQIEEILARYAENDLEDSNKSFSDCLTKDETGEVIGAECHLNTVSVADIVTFRASRPKRLNLKKCKFDGDVVSACSTLSSLEELRLWGCPISDEDMVHVSKLVNLKKLDLRQTSISDNGLVSIGSMTGLESLELLETKITGNGMKALRGLAHLKKLSVVNTAVDDLGMVAITSLRTLEELQLEGTRITNHGLEEIGRLTELRLLTIHIIESVDEDGLQYLEQLQRLQTLYLCVPVTEKGVASLKKLSSLRHLYMGDVIADTPFDHRRLGQELPGVGVY